MCGSGTPFDFAQGRLCSTLLTLIWFWCRLWAIAVSLCSAAVPAAVRRASRPPRRGRDALGDSRQDAGATSKRRTEPAL